MSTWWRFSILEAFYRLNTVFLVPVELLSRRTHTLVTARCVHTAVFTASVIDAALVNIAAVCEAIETVAFVANTLEATRVVDADVITRPLKGALVNILTGALIGQKFVSFLTAALKTAHSITTEMIATPIILQTFVNIFAGFAIGLKGEAHGTTAADTSRRVLASAIAAAVVHRTGLNAGLAV